MITVFGEEKFRPVVRLGVTGYKVVPDYYVSKKCEVYSRKTDRYLTIHSDKEGKYKKLSLQLPVDLFPEDDFNYYQDGSNSSRVSFDGHRIVKEAWHPIDLYPPARLDEEWNQVITADMVGQPRIPDNWKQWVRETAAIDHVDGNPANNYLENLEYVTPKENNQYRKDHESAKVSGEESEDTDDGGNDEAS